MNCMRSLPALSILWALCCCRLPLAAQPPCDAAQVWEKLIAAKGGREKLESVRAFFVNEQQTWRTWGIVRHRRDIRSLYVEPSFWWRWDDTDTPMFGVTISQADFDRGMGASLNASSRFRPVFKASTSSPKVLVDDVIAAYLVETKWLKPKVLGCAIAVEEGRSVITVDTESARFTYRYFLDAKTYLPVRLEQQDGRWAAEHYLEEYRRVDGIMLPGRRRYDYGGSIRTDFTVRYEINPAYDPDLWKRDPSVEAGPDAWRLKKR